MDAAAAASSAPASDDDDDDDPFTELYAASAGTVRQQRRAHAVVVTLNDLSEQAEHLARHGALVRVVGRLAKYDARADVCVLEYRQWRVAVRAAHLRECSTGALVEVLGRVTRCAVSSGTDNGEDGIDDACNATAVSAAAPTLPAYCANECFIGCRAAAVADAHCADKLLLDAEIVRDVSGLDTALYEQALRMRQKFLATYFAETAAER